MESKNQNIGKVIKCTRNFYLVDVNGKTIKCLIKGKLFCGSNKKSISIKVGDDVKIKQTSSHVSFIEKILERRSQLSRAVEGKAYREQIIATNIDQIVVIMSTRNPPFKSGLLDRYLLIAEKNRLQAKICINKIDLSTEEEYKIYLDWYSKIGYTLIFTSAINKQGKDEFISILKDRTTVLVGQSGVGKSSLIGCVEPDFKLKTSAISEKSKKGVHTTSSVQLFSLSFGGYIVDTPGIRELGLWGIYKEDLKNYFKEFSKYYHKCQFNDCLHLSEPGCEIKNALRDQKIFNERYQNYQNIYQGLRSTPYELIKFK
jgi:ribosome biogenesis GTPase